MSAVSAEEFQQLLVRHLRDDGWQVDELGPLEIRVSVPGDSSPAVFSLANLYQVFLDGALVGSIADSLVRTLREADESAAPLEQLERKRLMPLLKPRTLLDEVARSRVEPIAWRPFICDDLIVTLVLDFPQSVRFVKQEEVERSGQSLDDLLETALGNLYERSSGAVYELGDDKTGKMFILATQDGYDATRILLAPLLERLARQVSGQLVIGIPNRDFFIAFGNANPLLVGQIGRQVRQDVQARNYPLTSALFTFRDRELKLYEE